jgi:Divergent InlB B-repeat domain/Bacterial Ig-like domain (group 2)
MNRSWFRRIVVCGAALLLSNCGHDQQLVSISIQPTAQTFGAPNIPLSQDVGASVQLRALGSFIHPPVTKDITTQVTWDSNTTGLATVSNSGILTATGMACGNALVSATVTKNSSDGGLTSSGALVTGYMTASVVCFNGPIVTLDFAGQGFGTVSSSPVGLGCATSCSASFPTGTTVTLVAAASPGSSFGGWAGCDSVSGTTCTISDLSNNITVTASFN